jgi:hypothetical protein
VASATLYLWGKTTMALDPALAGLGGAVIAGALSVIGNAIVTARATGKTEGTIQTALAGLSKRVDEVDDDNKSQWKTIERHTSEIGYLQGKVNGRAHHP